MTKPVSTADIAAFIAARLDERERNAASTGGNTIIFTAGGPGGGGGGGGGSAATWQETSCGSSTASGGGGGGGISSAPAVRERLREVAAMRAIVDAYVKLNEDVPLQLRSFPRAHGRWDGLSVAVRHLAAIWADHPDYRQEWA